MIAVNLETGTACLEKLTRAQSSTLLDVASSYIETARTRQLAEQRQCIIRGTSTLSELHNRRRHQPPANTERQRLVAQCQPLVAECQHILAECHRLVAEYHRLIAESDRVKRALERLAERAHVIRAAE